MSALADLRIALKTGRALRRRAWPSYSVWRYSATAPLVFVDRDTHRLFWSDVMCDAVVPGLPQGLTSEDIRADDWETL